MRPLPPRRSPWVPARVPPEGTSWPEAQSVPESSFSLTQQRVNRSFSLRSAPREKPRGHTEPGPVEARGARHAPPCGAASPASPSLPSGASPCIGASSKPPRSRGVWLKLFVPAGTKVTRCSAGRRALVFCMLQTRLRPGTLSMASLDIRHPAGSSLLCISPGGRPTT